MAQHERAKSKIPRDSIDSTTTTFAPSTSRGAVTDRRQRDRHEHLTTKQKNCEWGAFGVGDRAVLRGRSGQGARRECQCGDAEHKSSVLVSVARTRSCVRAHDGGGRRKRSGGGVQRLRGGRGCFSFLCCVLRCWCGGIVDSMEQAHLGSTLRLISRCLCTEQAGCVWNDAVCRECQCR